jgi:hypothetical protein
MMRLVGGEEQRLGPRRHVVTVEHELADLGTQIGAAGLTGAHDLAADVLEGIGEQRHLGGLAGAVAALEGDEDPHTGHEREPSRDR